jgi:tetratricopeptide (TPR) repeat protein
MEPTINQIFDQAIKFHRDGKLDQAESLYREILKTKPEHLDTNNNLSIILEHYGKLEQAKEYLKKAIELKSDFFYAHCNLGNIFQKQEKFNEAEKSYRKAIELNPEYVEAYRGLGNSLFGLDRINEAEKSYRKAIELNFDYAETHNNLGVTLQKQEKFNEAEKSYRKAIELDSDYAQSYSNLGITLSELGELNEAEKSYRKAIELKPDYVEAHYNLGLALFDLGRLDEAEASYKKVIEIKPSYLEAYNNLGLALFDLGRLDEAEASYKKVIEIKPGYAKAWNNIISPLLAIKVQNLSVEDRVPLLNEQVTSKYAQVAKSILSYRLNLGSLSAGNSLNKVLSILSSTNNTFIKNPRVPSNKLITGLTPPKKIAALVHFGRSGTGMLHSLIDGHSEVSTLPSIYFSEFFDYETWEKIIAGGWEEMSDRFATTYAVLFDASSAVKVATTSKHFIDNIGRKEGMANVGTKKDEVLSVDKKIFIKELNQLIDCQDHLDPFIFFKLVHSAYDKALQDHNEKKLIFYHIHNPDTYAQLNFLRLEPNTNWLMLVREPLQSCESWVRESFQDNDYKKIVNKIFQMLFEVDHVIYRNENSIGVRLEDLKENPKKTIPALCSWLGIEEKDSLYQMTAQGKKWWGDQASPDFEKDGMNPFGKTSIYRKLGLIFSNNDQFILRTLFYPFSVQFGYVKENLKQFKKDLQIIRPMLDQMFDFEKKIAQHTKVSAEKFMKSGSYLFLRSGMIERWKTLNKFYTYPNMLTPLKINQS